MLLHIIVFITFQAPEDAGYAATVIETSSASGCTQSTVLIVMLLIFALLVHLKN